jgi:hypothetical protein
VKQESLSEDLLDFLRNVHQFLTDFDHWWKTPLADTYSSMGLIKEDLHTLKQKCEHLHLLVGQPLSVCGTMFPDVWSTLEYLSMLKRTELRDEGWSPLLEDEINTLKTVVDAIPEVLSQYLAIEDFNIIVDNYYDVPGIRDTLQQYEQRFTVISAALQQLKTLRTDVQLLQARLNSSATGQTVGTQGRGHPLLQRIASSRPASPAVGGSNDTDLPARFNLLELKLTQLEKRMVGEGVTIGSFTFQSLDDVKCWCHRNLPTNRFGLFLDGVSIFEFLAQDHTDSAEVLT